MSKKEELLKAITEFKEQYSAVQAKISNVKNSEAYSDVGKQQMIKQIEEEFSSSTQICHDKAIKCIDDGLTSLGEKWRANSVGRLSDTGYQMGLSNVFKIIEAGAIRDIADLKGIIDTYKDDFNAIAAIRNIISNSGRGMDLIGIIPEDTRADNKKLLGQLKNNIDQYISPVRTGNEEVSTGGIWHGTSSTLMALDSMADFVSTRLEDELSLM